MEKAGRTRRRPGLRALTATAILALLVTGAAPAAEGRVGSGQTGARPGGQSAGDRLFPSIGNTGYDVRHYAIRLGYSSATGAIAATTTVFARAAHPLSSFSLDLEGLRVSKVLVDGRAAAVRRHHDKLVVTPARPVTGPFVTRVTYAGKPVTHIDPDGAKDGWVPTADGGATVVAEPVGASTWFPNNNTPRDKATYSIRVTAPTALPVAGSGDLRGRTTVKGRTTWTWVQTRPMASYLAMVSIGDYRVFHSTMRTTTGRRLPVWSFIARRFGPLAEKRALIPGIIRFEERRFGPYPQTSTGMVVNDVGVGYALETQNRPVYDGVPGTSTIVHELAHQWYGDAVTPRHWGDIWLNEGFATYASNLWAANHGGPSTAVRFQEQYDGHPASSLLWRPAPGALTGPAQLFGSPVYTRGSMTLQALRQRVGSADFFTILRRWAARDPGRPVATADFVAVAQRVSGQHLGRLFHRWVYVPQRPAGY